MCVSNSCLFFAFVKKKNFKSESELTELSSCWIVLEMTCANYPTPKPLVKGKDSQTVGRTP